MVECIGGDFFILIKREGGVFLVYIPQKGGKTGEEDDGNYFIGKKKKYGWGTLQK